MAQDFIIRLLTDADAPLWQPLRLAALDESPRMFGAALVDEQDIPPAAIQKKLAQERHFGAFAGDALIGAIGYDTPRFVKMAHKAHIYAAYVRPDWRRRGVMDGLLRALLADADRRGPVQIASVVVGNDAMLKLLIAHGFTAYGTEPRALKQGDDYDDLILLRREKP